MHDEHVLNHSSKYSSEIIQSKEIKNVNVNSTSSHVIIVHDTTSWAMETIPNQDKQYDYNVHCPVGNSDRPLTEIIELCEDVISIDPDNSLNKTLQENCSLLKTLTEDQQSVTLKSTHCNEAAESGCEINTITNVANGESLAPETYQSNEELSHSMPAKTVNLSLKTQSEKSGPSEQSASLRKSTTLNDFQRSCKRNFRKSRSNHRPRDWQRYLEFVRKTLHPRVTRPPIRLRTTNGIQPDLPRLQAVEHLLKDSHPPLPSIGQVKTVLKHLNPSKATGSDNIPAWCLKRYADELAPVVHDIVVASIVQCKYPTSYKHAIISPIPKIRPPTDLDNDCRQVSVLPQLAKVIEKLQLQLNKSSFKIKTNQHAFTSGHSTVSALTSISQNWFDSTDNSSTGRQGVHALFVDFRKAFDLVDHKILLDKLLI
ncbi:Hypothetical predicted protein [Paramuricea clavata]|uniref:Uncharacterized protein n=1 Tax=Paramuricea clavata TaxID=317549 RepID=A0A6S7HCZ9_PARCT|nr:Hypothetical predicted protein [Paramuricea clavata]